MVDSFRSAIHIVTVDVLRKAMRRLIYRYPSKQTGLCACDEELLRQTVEKGPTAAWIIGHTIGELLETEEFLGDAYARGSAKAAGTQGCANHCPDLPYRGGKGGCAEGMTELTNDEIFEALKDACPGISEKRLKSGGTRYSRSGFNSIWNRATKRFLAAGVEAFHESGDRSF